LFPWWGREDIMKIRVSTATASLLGLKKYRIAVPPTTLYFLLSGKCHGRCGYCTHVSGYLSRVKWPEFDMEMVAGRIGESNAKRICIQSPYGKEYVETAARVAKILSRYMPVSASISAMEREELKMLKEAGVERVGVGLDCATPSIFRKWKRGVPSWDSYMKTLEDAKKIFGNATCHLIIGLGESDEEAINLMKDMRRKGIDVALFALFLKGENRVELSRYRAMQIARYAIYEDDGIFYFKDGKLVEMKVKKIDEKAFHTSGCPNCNRPFYNERVTKIYNYPRPLDRKEFEEAIKEAKKYARIYAATWQGEKHAA